MGRSLLNFVKGNYISLSILLASTLIVLSIGYYINKSINDGIVNSHGEKTAYASEVSKEEAERLDSTLVKLYPHFLESGEVSSKRGLGQYSILTHYKDSTGKTSSEILHEIIDSSGLKVEHKREL